MCNVTTPAGGGHPNWLDAESRGIEQARPGDACDGKLDLTMRASVIDLRSHFGEPSRRIGIVAFNVSFSFPSATWEREKAHSRRNQGGEWQAREGRSVQIHHLKVS